LDFDWYLDQNPNNLLLKTPQKVKVSENCGLSMHYINAPNIILGIANPLDSYNTINQVLFI
jgi:hypothetical protein